MNVIRQIIRPENGKLMIEVPEDMQNQSFEVIVTPLENVDEAMLNILKITNQESLKGKFWESVNDLRSEAKQTGLTEEILADE